MGHDYRTRARNEDRDLGDLLTFAAAMQSLARNLSSMESRIKASQSSTIPENFGGPDAVAFTRTIDQVRSRIKDFIVASEALSLEARRAFVDEAYTWMVSIRSERIREKDSLLGDIGTRIQNLTDPISPLWGHRETWGERIPKPVRPALPSPDCKPTVSLSEWTDRILEIS